MGISTKLGISNEVFFSDVRVRKNVLETQLLSPFGYLTAYKAKFMKIHLESYKTALCDLSELVVSHFLLCCANTQHKLCFKRRTTSRFVPDSFLEARVLATVFLVELIIFIYGTRFDLSYFRNVLRKCCCLLSVVFTPFIPLFCNTMNQLEAAGIPT